MQYITSETNADVSQTVKNNKYSIGYISTGYIDEGLKTLKVNGIEASIDSVKDGSYIVVRKLYLFTRTTPPEKVKNFVDFVKKEESKKIIMKEGFLSDR